MRRFAFRLALELGMTVRELLSRMDARELAEWRIYAERIEPLPADRADVQRAMGFASMVSMWSAKGRSCDPEIFMPWMRESRSREPRPPGELMAKFRAVAGLLGARRVNPTTGDAADGDDRESHREPDGSDGSVHQVDA